MSSLPEAPQAVVVGLCAHGLGMVRDLYKAGIKVIALESNPFLPAVHTRMADIRFVADISGNNVVRSLINLAMTSCFRTKPVLMLTNDRMVEAIGHHIDEITQHYLLSWSACASAILSLLQKDQIEQRCNQTGISYPRSLLAIDMAGMESVLANLRLPIIIKPTRPLSAFKTIVIETTEQIQQHKDVIASSLPVLAQEFIPGDDRKIRFGALYLDKGEVIARFEGRKLKSRPMGHTTIAVPEPNEIIHTLACRFFKGLNISGPVSLEVKEDPKGQQWVIEPTVGRTDFWAGMCSANGINLSEIEYTNVSCKPVLLQKQRSTHMWINGERHASALLWLLKNEPLKFLQYRIRGVYLDEQDIKPFLSASEKLAKRLSTGLRKRLGINRHRHIDETARSNVRKIDNLNQADELTLSLFTEASCQSIELSSEWFESLQNTVFCNDSSVGYYIGYKSEHPVAVLPLRWSQRGLLKKTESLSNYYTSFYSPIVSDEANSESFAALFRAASMDQGNAHMIRLAPMDPNSPTYAALLTALRSLGWLPFRYFCFGNWFLDVDCDWKSYLEQRPGELRSTLKRKGRKFTADGGMLEIITDPAQVESAIDDFNHVYSRSWKKPEPYPDFIPSLVRWLSKKGWLRLGVARLGGQAIAAEIWVVNHGKASIFKLAHNSDFSDYAPGTLLTAHLMKHALEHDRVHEVDYLIGDDHYKRDWMSKRRERWGLVAYNARTFWGLLFLGKEMSSRLIRQLVPRL